MEYSFDFRLYSRPFRQPLITSHGVWKKREGIIIHLTDKVGRMGWGEIAPLSWFGSETLQEALGFCQGLNGKITLDKIKAIPNSLPGCQFGFESALEGVNLSQLYPPKEIKKNKRIKYSYLLPAGKNVLEAWKDGYNQEIKTFKWKIGVSDIKEEMTIFKTLINILPKEVTLRLDANGGLSLSEAQKWLEIADKSEIIEFIEQPLSPLEFDSMVKLSQDYITLLALDESVSNLIQLEQCYQQGWLEIFVVKPAIAGFPSRLRQLCKMYSLDLVFSSVFETAITQQYIINLAEELIPQGRPMGFGVNDWFQDSNKNWLNNLWKNS